MTATNTKEARNVQTKQNSMKVKAKNDDVKQGEVITLSRIDKAAEAIIGQLRKSDQAAIEAGPKSVEYMLDVFKKRRELILKEIETIPALKAFKPSGAFYLFCDISATGLSALEFSSRLLEEVNVAVIPSEPFGIAQHIRLSFAVSDDNIVKGLARIREWTAKL